jgi:hypothetical protein
MGALQSIAFAVSCAVTIFFTGSASAKSGPAINIRVAPLGLLVDVISTDVNVAVGEDWSLGPQFSSSHLKVSDYTISGTSFGLRGNYFFGGASFAEGWYLGPFASYSNWQVKDESPGVNKEGSASGVTIGAILGYHWAWENFNIDFGLGGAGTSFGTVKVKDNNTGQEENVNVGFIGVTYEFMIGWAF